MQNVRQPQYFVVITVRLEFDFVIATWKATKEAERAKWGGM